jgi:hypothetical protein
MYILFDMPRLLLTYSSQEVHVASHHHFITDPSIFVLVFDTTDPKMGLVENWLKFITYKKSKVPIGVLHERVIYLILAYLNILVLIGTRLDKKPKLSGHSIWETENMGKLQSNFPFLNGNSIFIYQTSLTLHTMQMVATLVVHWVQIWTM